MIGRGLFVVTILSTCVLSLPATPSQLENEDVEVMKCIVEALADVLSRPRPMPVSQECLVTLKTDDRLVSILRHRNFLKELQEIAVQGGQESAQLLRDAGEPEPTPQTDDDAAADQSMLDALGGLGERSILTQKRLTGSEEKDDSKAEETEEEDHSEEENMIRDKKSAGFAEKRDTPRIKSKGKKLVEEGDGAIEKRSPFFSHRPKQEEEEEEEDGGEMNSSKRWNKRGKLLQMKSKAVREAAQELNSQRGPPHHSKEVTEEEGEEEKKKRNRQRSLEQKQLQMIARRRHERRELEEEGSGSQKPEEPEIESLASIESELENFAQKLHGMRRRG